MQLTDRPTLAQTFADSLPQPIRDALQSYAQEINAPIDSVLEMAIAFFLDVDCAGFDDCRTETPGQLRSRLEILETFLKAKNISVPEL
jgi:hypothetical protein